MDYNDAILGINCAEIFEGGGGVELSTTEEKWVRIIRELAAIRGMITLTKDKILACWRNEPCLVRANEAAYVKAFRDYYEYVLKEGIDSEGPVLFGMKLSALGADSSVLNYKSRSLEIPTYYNMDNPSDDWAEHRIARLLENCDEDSHLLEVLTMTVNLDMERERSDKVFMIPARLYDCFVCTFPKLDIEQKKEFVREYLILTWDNVRNDYISKSEGRLLADKPGVDYVRCFFKSTDPKLLKEDFEDVAFIIKDKGNVSSDWDEAATLAFRDIKLEYKSNKPIASATSHIVKSSISVYVESRLVGIVYYNSNMVDLLFEGEPTTVSVIRAVMSKL